MHLARKEELDYMPAHLFFSLLEINNNVDQKELKDENKITTIEITFQNKIINCK